MDPPGCSSPETSVETSREENVTIVASRFFGSSPDIFTDLAGSSGTSFYEDEAILQVLAERYWDSVSLRRFLASIVDLCLSPFFFLLSFCFRLITFCQKHFISFLDKRVSLTLICRLVSASQLVISDITGWEAGTRARRKNFYHVVVATLLSNGERKNFASR